MLTLYTSPSCTSCRKAKNWLDEHQITYKERNVLNNPLSENELLHILSLTLDGTDEIISTRSKVFKKMKVDIEDLSLSELLKLIQRNPSLLRRPLLIDERRLQIGFNEDEIRAFLPRTIRKLEMQYAQLLSGI